MSHNYGVQVFITIREQVNSSPGLPFPAAYGALPPVCSLQTFRVGSGGILRTDRYQCLALHMCMQDLLQPSRRHISDELSGPARPLGNKIPYLCGVMASVKQLTGQQPTSINDCRVA